jgi:hypothetical protein
VREHVEAGVGSRQLVSPALAEEGGARHVLAQHGSGGPGPHDDQTYPVERGDPGQQLDPLLGGQPADVDRGHADDWVGERAGLARPARRMGRNNKRLVTTAGEELGNAEDAVRHAVDVGWERLGDNRDPHDHKVRYQPIAASQGP